VLVFCSSDPTAERHLPNRLELEVSASRAAQAVPHALQTVMSTVLIHKFCRAPFGNCTFWLQLKEVAQIFVDEKWLDCQGF
jgi:hypothetical protein